MKFSLEAIRDGATMPDLLRNLPKIPVASAISGLIVAALILLTPNSWFEAFVVESGLPAAISAAEPPLGARARIVFALAAALLITIIAWGALSATVGRKMRQKVEARRIAEDDEFDPEVRARALRRGDAHPDAPYRRPIMAADDLGTALDDVDVEAVLEEEPNVADEDELVIEAPSSDEDPELDALDLGAVAEILEDEPEEDIAPAVEPEIAAETEELEQAAVVDDEPGEPAFEISLPRRDNATVRQAPAAAEPALSADLAELVARLEAGLERKRAQRAPSQDIPENVTAHPQARPAEAKDEALKDALDALQQVSGKAS